MGIGNRIKAARNSLHLTQEELAKKVGVTKGAIANYENDVSHPKEPVIYALIEALQVDANYLFQDVVGFPDSSKLSAFEIEQIKKYRALDEHGKRMVDYAIAEETARMEAARKVVELPAPKKVIPLIGNRFAAGFGDPDLNVAWEDYEVDADSKAEFAVHIHGDSLEPHLHDGDIALAVKRLPDDGEVGAFLVDGEFLVKQVVEDAFGNLYLFALNRKRDDTDRKLWHFEEHQFVCFGTLLLPRIPLPKV